MKVAVIGGGPAGLFAARYLAKRNARVDLFDRGIIGNNVVCGECIFDFYQLMSKPQSGYLFDVDNIVIRLGSIYSHKFRRKKRLWMIDRREWQLGIAQEAVKLGANIFENYPVCPKTLQDFSERYDAVIDCSGAPSVSGCTFGFAKEYTDNFNPICKYLLKGDFSWVGKSLYIGFLPDYNPDDIRDSYWIFPQSETYANVGLACYRNTVGRAGDMWGRLNQVLQYEKIDNYEIISRGGGMLPTRMMSQLVYNNVLLAGDAAGVASELTGQGIDFACISGVLAAKAILQDEINDYDTAVRNFFAGQRQFDSCLLKLFLEKDFLELDRLCDAFLNKKLLKIVLAFPDIIKILRYSSFLQRRTLELL